MSRIFLIVVAVGLLLIGIGVVWLGTFPPHPVQHPVERTLPNDTFKAH